MGPKRLKGEHGLSFLIEKDGHKLLFDTGQTGIFAENAAILGVNPADISTVVLSHGHYDHTGGLPVLLDMVPDLTIHAHPDAFYPKFVRHNTGDMPIGMPVTREELEHRGVTLRLDVSPSKPGPEIMTTGEIPMITDFEETEPLFFTERSGEKIPDTFTDDQALILDTAKGIVVVFGCAHRGVVNTLEHVVKLTGKPKIHAIMGGLHLGNASGEKLEKIVQAFERFGIEQIGVCHCTGYQATITLGHIFGNRMFMTGTGRTVSF